MRDPEKDLGRTVVFIQQLSDNLHSYRSAELCACLCGNVIFALSVLFRRFGSDHFEHQEGIPWHSSVRPIA
jgi:hypothetical protein